MDEGFKNFIKNVLSEPETVAGAEFVQQNDGHVIITVPLHNVGSLCLQCLLDALDGLNILPKSVKTVHLCTRRRDLVAFLKNQGFVADLSVGDGKNQTFRIPSQLVK